MRVVLDTNVLFAAFATHGLCEEVLRLCLSRHEMVLSAHILSELQRHLRSKLKLPADHADDIIASLRAEARLVEPAAVDANACRDQTDLMVLGTALAGKVNFLITGDRDLLALSSFGHTQIVSPRSFYEKLK